MALKSEVLKDQIATVRYWIDNDGPRSMAHSAIQTMRSLVVLTTAIEATFSELEMAIRTPPATSNEKALAHEALSKLEHELEDAHPSQRANDLGLAWRW